MKLLKKGAAALVACIVIFSAHSAQAQHQRLYQTANMPAEGAGPSIGPYNSFDTYGNSGCEVGDCYGGDCDSCLGDCYCDSCAGGDCYGGCGSGGCCLGGGLCSRPGQFFLVGEYIYARASLSEALAYVVSDPNDPQGGQDFVEFDFNHQSSYRFSGGYRFCDCGGEIVFNYARYRSEAEFNVQDESNSPFTTIFSPYEIDAPGDNGFLQGAADVDLKSYDLGIAKTMPLGSPLGCYSCCDDCCGDGCGCCNDCGCSCPAWDITWSAGVRFADMDWSHSTLALTNQGDEVDTASTRLDFEGAGARVGVLARRYVGRQGFMSIYAKGDISLLVGRMNIETLTTDDPDGSAPLTFRSNSNTGRRMIPVTEIEAGLTAHFRRIQFSSGYFLAAWHDLGFRDEYDFGQFQLSNYDDANILGFDGFFARAEVAF